jgi:pSer/pThr/pTyr-binding forkhead associated (FHA) protein
VARYRLRFLLQEFDLRGPEVLIGRSPECHITIEDPLVSREHAKIMVEGDRPTIEDLGSRNGVRINGERIAEKTELAHGDRVRLGTQELVFYQAAKHRREARTTGFMTVCHSCRTPYPEKAKQCPHCGAAARDEDTMSGLLVEPRRTWTFQLLGEVIERALATERISEAVRLMRRAAREVDERLTASEGIDPEQLTHISGFALQLANKGGGVEWVHWALNVHRQQKLFPNEPLIERLEALDLKKLPDLQIVLGEFAQWANEQRETLRPPPERGKVQRLERLAGR